MLDLLLAQSSKRWPDVFGEAVIAQIRNSVVNITDQPIQLLRSRAELLSAARAACDNCVKCSLAANRYSGCVFADGTVTARVFIIGEGPGQFEQRTLIPFCHTNEYRASDCFIACKKHDVCFDKDCMAKGLPLPDIDCSFQPIPEVEQLKSLKTEPMVPNSTSGILNTEMSGLYTRNSWNQRRILQGFPGIGSDLYITNIVKCRPVDTTGKDRAPLVTEQKLCRDWLDIQLALVQPSVVILVGRVAAQTFLGGNFSIKQSNGLFVPVGNYGEKLPKSVKWLGAMMHPSGISRLAVSDVAEARARMQSVFIAARSIGQKAI